MAGWDCDAYAYFDGHAYAYDVYCAIVYISIDFFIIDVLAFYNKCCLIWPKQSSKKIFLKLNNFFIQLQNKIAKSQFWPFFS